MEKAEAKPLHCLPQNLKPIESQPEDLDPQFTESELAAAEQLICLSESTGATASANSNMASASSSPRSVNTRLDDGLEDDEALWRRLKRYRSIADVYALTVRIDGEGGHKKERRKKKESTK